MPLMWAEEAFAGKRRMGIGSKDGNGRPKGEISSGKKECGQREMLEMAALGH